HGAGRVRVPAWIHVVVGDPVAHFENGEHAPHSNTAERSVAAHHGQRVLRPLHVHVHHVVHAVLAHRHVTGQERANAVFEARLVDTDYVGRVVPHGIHGVMAAMTVQRPIARVGNELDV